MTMTLLILGLIAAANPFRAAAAAPPRSEPATLALAVGGAGFLGVLAAWASGPLLDLVDVSGPSARIAAGIALLVVAGKDLFFKPPTAEPSITGRSAGLFPLAFPVIFSPAFAVVAIAGASERGVGPTTIAIAMSLVPTAAALAVVPIERTRLLAATVGAAGAAIAALLVLDGVYAI